MSLDRPAGTLSGGEAQRTKTIRHPGSSLTDLSYIFGESTVGLHPHDIQRMNTLLLQFRDKGNTVLVVEHKPETIAIADHFVDLGPRAGVNSGRIQFTGTIEPANRRTGEPWNRRTVEPWNRRTGAGERHPHRQTLQRPGRARADVAHADWIIDIGPDVGNHGGKVVFEGTPAQIVTDASTLAGQHLKEYVGA